MNTEKSNETRISRLHTDLMQLKADYNGLKSGFKASENKLRKVCKFVAKTLLVGVNKKKISKC